MTQIYRLFWSKKRKNFLKIFEKSLLFTQTDGKIISIVRFSVHRKCYDIDTEMRNTSQENQPKRRYVGIGRMFCLLYRVADSKKEEKGMKYASISNSEKFWEVIYASIMLEGKEREDALKRLQVPANPNAAA